KMDRIGAEQIKALIAPLGENIERFRSRVDQVHSEQSKERFSLEKEIKRLVDTNQRISEDATNLTNALKGSNKTQGNWGEMILERILESSGLVCGVEGYELQGMLRDSAGNALRSEDGKKMIPDAVVHFPDSRNVIIDSKVSLLSYLNYCNSETPEQQQVELKKHIQSIKSHIAELDVKSYENYVEGSLDFVMMFIPNESAYIVAMQGEPALWNDAYKKKVLLISPTNLITSLKIVADLWTREKQNKNVEDIIARGEKLYEKCRTFLEALTKIEKGIASASQSYDEAYKLLVGSGGLVRQAEMLKELGVKSKKELPIKSVEKEDE
ncbi:MAG: DNA recombination protein RmuC, partial [Rikenellaceae bacterium]